MQRTLTACMNVCVVNLKEHVGSLHERVDSLQEGVANLQEHVDRLHERVDSLQEGVVKL